MNKWVLFTTRELWILRNSLIGYKYATGEAKVISNEIKKELKNRGEVVY